MSVCLRRVTFVKCLIGSTATPPGEAERADTPQARTSTTVMRSPVGSVMALV
ncbi:MULTISPECIES: hypothetical protein [Mycolicibacterium]|uniref:hypothetical protein n=1 Tax=Mycolicibacterium TaxID=1866885 RepID=UPI001427B8C9|nr:MULTISPECIES: hypothetical protein [Mycolicibacterium]MCV7335906.1 hypothetical protein [Mycolicibacterium senegalense]MDR7288972.1 hypothetical protein [Mycolicibacterium senegalense]QZA25859.1 hypothetical protein K3U95_07290 [Mycolicibacterium senegalense]